MITNVNITPTAVRPGEKVVLSVDAAYPVTIEIYGFRTKPYPPECVLWPKGGDVYNVPERQPFSFNVDRDLFENDGFVEFRISDATKDFQVHSVKVKTL